MTKLISLSTEGKFAIVDDDVYERLLPFNWTYVLYDDNEYARRTQRNERKSISVFMQYEIMGTKKGLILDHIDLNGLNNTRNNLRWATYSQNLHNRGVYKNNTSGYKGVSWFKRDQKWRADIAVDGKNIFLGYYADILDAVAAYDEAAIRYMGEFARPNLNLP